MKDLLAPAILATDKNGKTRIFEMPNNPIFWEEGKQISIEKALEKLRGRNPHVEFKQMTLIEHFEYVIKSENYVCPHTFENAEEHFNYWLRVKLDYDFSNVDEKTYTTWYQNLNNGIETVYL